MVHNYAGAYILSALEESGRDPAEVSFAMRSFWLFVKIQHADILWVTERGLCSPLSTCQDGYEDYQLLDG
jgi:hypothetical protein